MCEIRDFDVSNHEVREVKDRTSGCERRDFSRTSSIFAYAGLKKGARKYGNKPIYILIYLILLFKLYIYNIRGFIQKCIQNVYKYLKCVEIQWLELIIFA